MPVAAVLAVAPQSRIDEKRSNGASGVAGRPKRSGSLRHRERANRREVSKRREVTQEV